MTSDLRWSLAPVDDIRALLEARRWGDVISRLRERPYDELRSCPELVLMLATALEATGAADEAAHWAELAGASARAQGSWLLEARSLVLCGRVQLQRKNAAAARHCFTAARSTALEQGCFRVVAESAAGLGAVARAGGDSPAAFEALLGAAAAWERAGSPEGAAAAYHELSNTCRDHGLIADAMWAAEQAVSAALEHGDPKLLGRVVAGRAETRIAAGDAGLGQREAEQAAATHRMLANDIDELEARRIVALAVGLQGDAAVALTMLDDVMERATALGHPGLQSRAQRDVARLRLIVTSDSKPDDGGAYGEVIDDRFVAVLDPAGAGPAPDANDSRCRRRWDRPIAGTREPRKESA